MTDLKKIESSWKPSGNSKVLWVSFIAFSLGFGIWAMFSSLGPFLIKWYGYTATQTLILSAMPPFFAACISIPLGVWADRYGGRKVFTITLIILFFTLMVVPFADSYLLFLICGMLLGLGGASFIIGNAHVSIWYPQSQQGTALGIFALGNIGIILGMVMVPFLITNLLGGPLDYPDMPAKFVFGPLAGWRFIFVIFAVPTLIMAIVYWTMTSEPPVQIKKKLTNREIINIFKSGSLVWVIAFLYWASFGTLTFFSAFSPTYLAVRWNVDPAQASMVYAASFVACVAIMRPIGGWFSDRLNPITMLTYLFFGTSVIAVVLFFEISFTIQITSMMCAALLAGAAAATVVKLIPTYYPKAVGTVSGLAKAAGAACGFTSTSIMAMSNYFTGSYKSGFFMWILVSVAAFGFVLFPKVFQQREREKEAALERRADYIDAFKNYEAMVLSCIDPRFQNFVNKENAKKGLTNKYSAFTIGGGSIGVVAPAFKKWHQAFWDNLDMSVQLHNIKKVIVINHRDCSAAKAAYGAEKVANREIETETHRSSLIQFRNQLKIKHPKLVTELYLMDLDGSVISFN